MPILIGVIALVLVISIVFLFMGRIRSGSLGGWKKSKDREAAMKEATKRLSQNPNDPEALFIMASAYFDDQNWDRAMKTYETLIEQMSANSNISGVDNFEVYLRSAFRRENSICLIRHSRVFRWQEATGRIILK